MLTNILILILIFLIPTGDFSSLLCSLLSFSESFEFFSPSFSFFDFSEPSSSFSFSSFNPEDTPNLKTPLLILPIYRYFCIIKGNFKINTWNNQTSLTFLCSRVFKFSPHIQKIKKLKTHKRRVCVQHE